MQMTPKCKHSTASSNGAIAPTTMGASSPQKAPISGKLNGFRH